MKTYNFLIIIFILVSATSCVQKSVEQVINLTLDVSHFDEPISTVGIRGEGQPLSWEKDIPMKQLYKDSIYIATIKVKTGYLFGEFKFTINGKFELENQDNRRVVFDPSMETNVKAIFNEIAKY